MKRTLLVSVAIFGFVALCRVLPLRGAGEAPAPPAPPGPWYAMFWNVSNLYDSAEAYNLIVKPKVSLDETDLAEKVRRLKEVVRRVNWGAGPDILGLAEVSSAEIVQRVAGNGYTVLFDKGTYERGLNVGLATRLPLESAPEYLDPKTTGRTILHANLKTGSGNLHVFVLHLKSKREAAAPPEKAAPGDTTERRRDDELMRARECRFLRERISDLLTESPGANVLVMGDFNEHCRDSLFRSGLLAREFRRGDDPPVLDDKDRSLLNYGPALQQSFPQGGTCSFAETWDIFDNFLLSEDLATRGGLFASSYDAWIGVSWDLLGNSGRPGPFAPGIPTRVSDHLPILLRIRS